jgi:exosortase/archaeosortase family protein
MAVVVLMLPLYLGETLAPALAPLTDLTARSAGALLDRAGVAVVWTGPVLEEPGGFGYRVIHRCTGVLPAVFLVVAVSTSPAARGARAIGVGLGVPLVLAINQLRLVHLFLVGRTSPEIYDFVHHVVWESAIVLVTLGIWVAWLLWARRGEPGMRRRTGARRHTGPLEADQPATL